MLAAAEPDDVLQLQMGAREDEIVAHLKTHNPALLGTYYQAIGRAGPVSQWERSQQDRRIQSTPSAAAHSIAAQLDQAEVDVVATGTMKRPTTPPNASAFVHPSATEAMSEVRRDLSIVGCVE